MDTDKTVLPRLLTFSRHVLTDLPERFSDEFASAARLACLFVIDGIVRRDMPDFRRVVADRLLDLTVRRAIETSTYYADEYTKAYVNLERPFRVEDLATLPLLERKHLQSEGPRLRSRDVDYGFSTFTSGTTSQQPLIIDRSVQEQRFVSNFFKSVHHESNASSKRFALNLANLYHGQTTEVPVVFHRIPVSVGTMTGLHTARDLLFRTFRTTETESRVSAVGGSLISLLRFSAYLEAEGLLGKVPQMEYIQSTSEYMTGRSRRQLKHLWNCPVEDRFGLSEIFIGAWRCQCCGDFHFEPYGLFEVIGVGSTAPISRGRGRLVLTGLYPFMQMVPMIRYLTGDLVELATSECPVGGQRIRLLGRASRSLIKNEVVLLGEYEIAEILDEESEVFRRPLSPALADFLREAGSPPVFRASIRHDGVPELEVAVRYDPDQYPERAEVLAQRIGEAVTRNRGFQCHISLISADKLRSV